MSTPRNCAVVTLPTGAHATYHNCDADQFVHGELTITDRATFAEEIYPAGSWTAYVVYDAQGHYLYACDCQVRVVLITGKDEGHACYR